MRSSHFPKPSELDELCSSRSAEPRASRRQLRRLRLGHCEPQPRRWGAGSNRPALFLQSGLLRLPRGPPTPLFPCVFCFYSGSFYFYFPPFYSSPYLASLLDSSGGSYSVYSCYFHTPLFFATVMKTPHHCSLSLEQHIVPSTALPGTDLCPHCVHLCPHCVR